MHNALVVAAVAACGTFSVEGDAPGGRGTDLVDGGGKTVERPSGSSGSGRGDSAVDDGGSSGVDSADGDALPDPCQLSLADLDCGPGEEHFRCAGQALRGNPNGVSLTRGGNEISALWARTQLDRATHYVVQFDVVIAPDTSTDPSVADGFAFSFVEPTPTFPTVSPAVPNVATLGVSALPDALGHAAFWRTVDSQTAHVGNFRFSTSELPGQQEQKLDDWNDAEDTGFYFEANQGTRMRVVVTHQAGAAQAGVRFSRVNDQGVLAIGDELRLDVPEVTGFVGVSASSGYKSQHSTQTVTGLSIACPP